MPRAIQGEFVPPTTQKSTRIEKYTIFFFFFFFYKTLFFFFNIIAGPLREHQHAPNTEVRPHIFTDNNACGAPIKPVLVPYY